MGHKTVMSDATAYVALGANLPSRFGAAQVTLRYAIGALAESGQQIESVSPFYRTPSVPAGDNPDYCNAAIAIKTQLDAPRLLTLLQQVEADVGRVRDVRWGSRVIDLDLIAFADLVLPDEATFRAWHDLPFEAQLRETPSELILPHPRMHQRAFVLVPLGDIAPHWRHPVLHRSVVEMTNALPPSERAAVQALHL